MATHSSILAWRIPWTEEPGGLQSLGTQSRTQLKRLGTHTRFLMLAILSGVRGYLIVKPQRILSCQHPQQHLVMSQPEDFMFMSLVSVLTSSDLQ